MLQLLIKIHAFQFFYISQLIKTVWFSWTNSILKIIIWVTFSSRLITNFYFVMAEEEQNYLEGIIRLVDPDYERSESSEPFTLKKVYEAVRLLDKNNKEDWYICKIYINIYIYIYYIYIYCLIIISIFFWFNLSDWYALK